MVSSPASFVIVFVVQHAPCVSFLLSLRAPWVACLADQSESCVLCFCIFCRSMRDVACWSRRLMSNAFGITEIAFCNVLGFTKKVFFFFFVIFCIADFFMRDSLYFINWNMLYICSLANNFICNAFCFINNIVCDAP